MQNPNVPYERTEADAVAERKSDEAWAQMLGETAVQEQTEVPVLYVADEERATVEVTVHDNFTAKDKRRVTPPNR